MVLSGYHMIEPRAEFFGRPVLILPEALDALRRGELSRFVGSRRGRQGETLPYRRTAEGVAIISVLGPLVHRADYSFESSYEVLQYQLGEVWADAECVGVLLDIESPGGQASGAFETALAVRRLAAKKPVVAVVNGMAASGAYAIASGASKIVTTPTGLSGSIGVVMLHMDATRLLDEAGLTPTVIRAGAKKWLGNPYEPLSEAARGELQAEVDQLYGQFIETVAVGRKRLSAAAIRATEAGTFIGVAAVAAGLADEVGSFETALDMLPKMQRGMIRRNALADGQRPEPQTASQSEWACAAARNLAIDMREGWDGDAARDRMLNAARHGGADFDVAQARRGFLAYDRHNPALKGSYKLPFADVVGGELKAVSGGLRAAASRLPGTGIPEAVRAEARAVIDGYEKRMRDGDGDGDDDDDAKSSIQEKDDMAEGDHMAQVTEAVAAALAADRTRRAAILALDEAQGREWLARQLADTDGMDAATAKPILAAAAKHSALEARAGGVPSLGSGGSAGAPDKQAAIDKGWAEIAASLNREHQHLPGFRAPK